MWKLLKYEIKGNYKLFLGILITSIIINTCILGNVDNSQQKTAIGSTIVVNACILVSIFIVSLNSFIIELNDDRGYLTFTLPIKATIIIGTKLVSTFIWLFSGYIIYRIFLYFITNKAYENVHGIFLSHALLNYSSSSIGIMYSSCLIISWIIFLLLCYLAIAISKVGVKNNKIGVLIAFITFICLCLVFMLPELLIYLSLPYSISVKGDATPLIRICQINNLLFSVDGKIASINISVLIYSILLCFGLFKLAAYFLDEKVDI